MYSDMFITKLLRLMSIVALVFSLQSCEFIGGIIDENNGNNDDEWQDESNDVPVEGRDDIELIFDDSFIHAVGGNLEVTVHTTHAWSLALEDSNDESEWCVPSKYEGDGSEEYDTVVFEVAPNKNDYVRNAMWVFTTDEGARGVLKLHQAEYDPAHARYEIRYTTSDDSPISLRDNIELYLIGVDGEPLADGSVSHGYEDGVGVIYIDGEVREISSWAFSNNSTLTSITLPECVESFDGNPFVECPALERFESTLATKSGRELMYCNIDTYDYILASVAPANLTSYTTPAETESLGAMSMYNLDNLTDITLNDNLLNIDEQAFYDCDGITEIVIPDQVKYIGKKAFSGCDNLEKVVLGKSVLGISESAFANCNSLATIELRATTPPTIKNSTFEDLDKHAIRVIVPSSALNLYKDSDWRFFNLVAEGTDLSSANVIRYTTLDGQPVDIYDTSNFDGVKLVSNTYDSEAGVGTILFDGDLRKIPQKMFYMCYTLTSVELPPFITTIPDYAFAECKQLETVTLPNALEKILYDAFSGCELLKDIDIPNTVTTISQSAFSGCKSLESIVIPETLESLGSYVFSGCESLRSVNIPEHFTSLSSGLFKGCKSLQSIKLPPSLQYIPDYIFSGCESLASIDIPDSVTSIGTGAFQDCKSLEGVVMSDNVTSIGSTCFDGCSGMRSITLSKNIEGIYGNTFSHCSSLTAITIPNKVTTISNYAFAWCSSLKEVSIPYRVAALDYRVFLECTSLEKVTFSAYLERIGSECFSGCTALTNISLPKSIKQIDSNAFKSCTALKKVEIEDLKAWFDMTFDYGTESNPTYHSRNLYLNGNEVTDLTVPDGVTTLDANDFSYLDNLKSLKVHDKVIGVFESWLIRHQSIESVEIGNGITEIGREAFRETPKLSKVTIGSGVKSIGYCAFRGCSNLQSITMPSSVTELSSYCFAECTSLQSATLSDNITIIPSDAFNGCVALKTVNIPTSVTEIKDSAFADCSKLSSKLTFTNVKKVYTYAFQNCESLKEVNFGEKLEEMGSAAFYNCAALQSAYLPNSVTKVGGNAFRGCTSMTHATIGSGTATIGSNAFVDCPALTTVKCYAVTPPKVTKDYTFNSLFDTDVTGRTIKVPEASVESYRTADMWKQYASEIVGF